MGEKLKSSLFLPPFSAPPLQVLPQLTESQPGLLPKVHGQRLTVPELGERMPRAHLSGPFRLHPGLPPSLSGFSALPRARTSSPEPAASSSHAALMRCTEPSTLCWGFKLHDHSCLHFLPSCYYRRLASVHRRVTSTNRQSSWDDDTDHFWAQEEPKLHRAKSKWSGDHRIPDKSGPHASKKCEKDKPHNSGCKCLKLRCAQVCVGNALRGRNWG